jgi:hypothetical protein
MPDETHLIRKVSWVLIIAIVAWPVVTLTATIIVFCFTRNPISLTLFPTLTTPVITYLVILLKPMLPMNEKRFQLAQKKIEVKKWRGPRRISKVL